MDEDLRHYMQTATEAGPERPVLIDRFLEDATEVDVDVISDGETSVVGAIMEHIEEAGIHSGDSACTIPPFSLSDSVQDQIRVAAKNLAKELNVLGLMNIQFAVKDEELFVIEVNPRASRTVPFVSKAIGVPLAKYAAMIMTGETTLKKLGFTEEIIPKHCSVKEAVFPFIKFAGVDIILGPEMKSTGEVMGIDENLGIAYAKSQAAASLSLPYQWEHLYQRQRCGQTGGRGYRAGFRRVGIRNLLHGRNGSRAGSCRDYGPASAEDWRGPS